MNPRNTSASSLAADQAQRKFHLSKSRPQALKHNWIMHERSLQGDGQIAKFVSRLSQILIAKLQVLFESEIEQTPIAAKLELLFMEVLNVDQFVVGGIASRTRVHFPRLLFVFAFSLRTFALAAAALRATSLRSSAVIFAMRPAALFLPPFRPSETAAGFLATQTA